MTTGEDLINILKASKAAKLFPNKNKRSATTNDEDDENIMQMHKSKRQRTTPADPSISPQKQQFMTLLNVDDIGHHHHADGGRKQIPGPAGLLLPSSSSDSSSLKDVSTSLVHKKHNNFSVDKYSANAQPQQMMIMVDQQQHKADSVDFIRGAWVAMLKDNNLPPFSIHIL